MTHSSPADGSTSGLWWRRVVVDQVYPRSFADADGDGLGDLRCYVTDLLAAALDTVVEHITSLSVGR